MHECVAVHDDDERFLHQPLSVLALATECSPVTEKTRRICAIEFRAQGFLIRRAEAQFLGSKNAIPALSVVRRLFIDKGRILARRHVAQIANQVHDFVIAE